MTPAEIRRLAARVYDDLRVMDRDAQPAKEMAFLAAINDAEQAWHDSMNAVRRLATRQRDADYLRAWEIYEADEVEMSEAAE